MLSYRDKEHRDQGDGGSRRMYFDHHDIVTVERRRGWSSQTNRGKKKVGPPFSGGETADRRRIQRPKLIKPAIQLYSRIQNWEANSIENSIRNMSLLSRLTQWAQLAP